MPQPTRKINRHQEEIMVIDANLSEADLNEAEMIAVVSQAKEEILVNNKPILVMTLFSSK